MDKKCFTIFLIFFILLSLMYPRKFVRAQKTKHNTPPQPHEEALGNGSKNTNASEQNLPVTYYSIKINEQILKYKATAGYMKLKDKLDKPMAKIFFIAYEKTSQTDKANRPIAFAFNGGPGASSVFLHLGALGPRRALLKDKGEDVSPPYKLVNNEYTWLPFTDLVFIDPVGTGYSRSMSGENPKQFYDVKKDIRLIADFIRLYLTQYKRWSSPKFIVGESYGTTRAAGLSEYLQDGLHINLNGLILISPVLDFQTIQFNQGNDLPYALFLPSYTATAWYHKKLAPELQSLDLPDLLDEVEDWTLNHYLPALAKGADLPSPERTLFIEKLANYTGLSPLFIDKKNLRIDQLDFAKEFFSLQNRLLGLMDSRLKGFDPDPADKGYEFDPSLFIVTGPFAAIMNDYMQNELHYQNDLTYEILNREVNRSWSWISGIPEKQGYFNVTGKLREAMSKNKYLKVFIAACYYDLVTPYFASDYTVNHLGLDPALRDNITLSKYYAGHQIYIKIPSLEKLTADVSAFISKQ